VAAASHAFGEIDNIDSTCPSMATRICNGASGYDKRAHTDDEHNNK
jgi:hypothetical protein